MSADDVYAEIIAQAMADVPRATVELAPHSVSVVANELVVNINAFDIVDAVAEKLHEMGVSEPGSAEVQVRVPLRLPVRA